MIYAIIYDNRPESGYDFYEETSGFPESYKPDILRISRQVSDPTGAETAEPALRYAPLKGLYLLSVIFRRPNGGKQQARGYNSIVHFLMDAVDANSLFYNGLNQYWEVIIHVAERFLNYRGKPLPSDMKFCADTERSGAPITAGKVSPSILLSGARYGVENMKKQLFIGIDSPAVREVSCLMNMLPYHLRKEISFHTDVCSGSESCGTALNFGRISKIEEMVSGDYPGSDGKDKFVYFCRDASEGRMRGVCDPDTNKTSGELYQAICSIEHYELFRLAINSWEEFLDLWGIRGASDPLAAALETVNEDAMANVIRQTDFDEKTLRRLEAAVPKKCRKIRDVLQAKRKKAEGLASQQELPQSAQPQTQQRERKAQETADAGRPQQKPRQRPGAYPQLRWLKGKGVRILIDLAVVFGAGFGLVKLVQHALSLGVTTSARYLIIQLSVEDALGMVELGGAALLGACLGVALLRLIQNLRK